jgi:hypothetical protein
MRSPPSNGSPVKSDPRIAEYPVTAAPIPTDSDTTVSRASTGARLRERSASLRSADVATPCVASPRREGAKRIANANACVHSQAPARSGPAAARLAVQASSRSRTMSFRQSCGSARASTARTMRGSSRALTNPPGRRRSARRRGRSTCARERAATRPRAGSRPARPTRSVSACRSARPPAARAAS